MSDLFFRIITHLLPTGQAWRLFPGKLLTLFMQGLTGFLAEIKQFIDLVWLDTQPQETRELEKWETIFGLDATGLTEQQRREALEGAWAALGGQSPRYIQDVIQAAGFDVYIHEWWVPGTNPPVARNPVGVFSLVWVQCGRDGVQCGRDGVQCGGLNAAGDGYTLVNRVTSDGGNQPAPADPLQWRYVLYFGGEVFGDTAEVPANRRGELEALLLRIKPAQQWLGLLIEYT